jgi:MbtH protein
MDVANKGFDHETYLVLINDEEQYSIWPARKAIPAGWKDVGVSGPKDECLEYIDRTWTDITPRSVRESLQRMRNGEKR